MSYTYLRGRAVESSEEYSWDIDPCALLKSNPIVARYCSPDNRTESSLNSPFGTTLLPSTENRGATGWTSFAADSPVKTLAAPVLERESPESAADYGWKCRESFAKLDPDSSLWKTHQCLLFEDWVEYLEVWPKWGIMQNGECFLAGSLVLDKTGTDYFCLPAPIKYDAVLLNFKTQSLVRDHSIASCWEFFARLGRSITPKTHLHLMRWPPGWNSLSPQGTDKFQQWLRLHFYNCQED